VRTGGQINGSRYRPHDARPEEDQTFKKRQPDKNEIPFAPFSSHVADIGADEVGDVFGQFFKTLQNITL
jgi:hypothetical protein